MTYVISDIHGEYEKYIAMLEKIGFSDDDVLYVLGDCIDRGPQPERVLQDMAARDNVYPIMGNHEMMALQLLPKLLVEITDENYATHVDGQMMSQLLDWQMDGGDATMNAFRRLTPQERADLLDYMAEFPLYEIADAGERTFVLVHAGLQNHTAGMRMREHAPEELLWGRHDTARQYFSDPSVFVVVGHTPTMSISGRAEIYRGNNNICIDCGAAFPGGRLACLCLETLEEFYVG